MDRFEDSKKITKLSPKSKILDNGSNLVDCLFTGSCLYVGSKSVRPECLFVEIDGSEGMKVTAPASNYSTKRLAKIKTRLID